jgi:hypothetical protein
MTFIYALDCRIQSLNQHRFVQVKLPIRRLANCSILEADESGRIKHICKSGSEILQQRRTSVSFSFNVFRIICTYVYCYTYICSRTHFITTCYVLNVYSPMYQ